MASRQLFRRLAPVIWNTVRCSGHRQTHLLPSTHVNSHYLSHPQGVGGTGARFMCAKTKFECINIQDAEDFQKRVIENKTPVVVDFHATWCGPCKLLGPRLENVIAGKEGKVVLAKVDIDNEPDLAMRFGVNSVPTVVFIKNGQQMTKFVGLQEEGDIDSLVEKLIN